MRFKIIFFTIGLIFLPTLVEAQCAMCRAVLESEGSEATAQGINDGIVYLMIFPYVLIGGIAFFIYRSFKKKKTSNS
ncbi:hypothetical protein [Gillisia limnaea]|uniref:Uncharacterized protein n=1 Tax=Gillisia limnaea (strain DSM 15749 / LMG 21470 / R-8282) TaxID=865937 RepID=H2BYI1_GILLR|nr:hypothetical protein [Gillisia limnaea]EHQ03320.1 hypothetical protein Gilli_2706 [Gillisia limnaea DSM 15749]